MIFAIGDIHGRADMLRPALAEIRLHLEPADTVVFLGDCIDRGNDSQGVVEAVLEFKARHENTVCLRGNHEQMMLDAYDHDEYALWMSNGGKETVKSYHGGVLPMMGEWRDSVPDEHLDFLRKTVLEWEAKHFHFVHAGLVPPSRRGEWSELRSLYLVPAEPRLWIRQEFIQAEDDFGKIVVFGHTVQKPYLPLIMNNKIGLDTGAVFGGRLTVGIFDDKTTQFWFFQVDQSQKVLELEAYQ